MTGTEPQPVLIVGAGPVGLATAYVLGMHGVRSVICEQYGGVNPHPRAHVVNTRSMELLRTWGIAEGVTADAVDPQWMLNIVWKQTLAGEALGRINLTDGPEERILGRINASPVMITSCAQDRVQQRLLDAVRAQGMCTVRYDTKVVSIDDTGDQVDVLVESRGEPKTVLARYVVAADGAAGSIRDALDIEMEGLPDLGHQLNIYFHADLSPWTSHDPALLIWAINTDSPGVFIGMDGVRRWTFNRTLDPASESAADYTSPRCAELIRKAVGVEDLDVDIRSVGTWTMAAKTAETYRKGRVFLAGDAAHQFPPTGGLGMNTGLADADNLAWKLAAVINGWAPDALLDSYQSERRPVAVDNARHSVTNAIKMAEAGVGPQTVEVAARLESSDPAVAAAERDRLAASIPKQRPHFDDLDQEIGYVYGCLDPTPSAARSIAAASGARMPHAWVEHDGAPVSTLDLTMPGLTLIAGRGGAAWADAFDEAAAGLPRQTLIVGRDVETGDGDPFRIGDAGAVLVRPDGHIAWRADATSSTPLSDLAAALDSVRCAAPAS